MKNFNYRQLTTILASLRHLQREMEESSIDNIIKQYPHFADVDPLSESDIDELCETMYSGLVCVNKPCLNDDQYTRYT
ncbi:MAG: hypothetical protein ABW107_22255, partial [Candidatus Thiodiazotropha sp. 6PLUC5]